MTMIAVKGLIILAFAVAYVICVERYQLDFKSIGKEWNAYKAKFNLKFNKAEELERFQIFYSNLKKIDTHNAGYEKNEYLYYLGLTQFAHWTKEEFDAFFVSYQQSESTSDVPQFQYNPELELPESFDWRDKGAVTPVKDQGQHCGSCWTFSTTAALEGAHQIKTGKLVSLSEQQLVDCDSSNGGCSGGLPTKAFEYIQKNGGINSEDSYPYQEKNGKCQYNPNAIAATCSGYVQVAEDESVIQQAVTTTPLSIIISTTHGFHHYKGGVFHEPECSQYELSHAVTLVGYGTENGTDYWIVKNSWGSKWGEKGYVRMQRNMNICNIVDVVSYPTV